MYEIPIRIADIGFIAHVTCEDNDVTDFYIDEIYPDDGSVWPYKNGLYDYLSKWTIEQAIREVSIALPEYRHSRLAEINE